MKLLTTNTSVVHLEVLKGLLEANGIPAVVNGANTASMISPFLMTEPSLWVYIDEQAEEAEKLMLDPDYEVQHKVDVDEFYRIATDAGDSAEQVNNTLINWAVGFSLLMIALILLPRIFGD